MAFFNELKRRNVIKATISYLVISFAIIEASDILFPVLAIDSSHIRVLFIILLIGLPIWIVFAYVYEWTPTGFKATDKVDEANSIHKITEKRLNRVIIAALALAVIFLLFDKFYLGKDKPFPENGSIAIFPFTVQGTENIQYLREGMVDLIATKLDVIPGIQATDPNILLTSFSKNQNNQALLRDPKEAAKLAREIGANRLVLGSLTEVGSVLQIKIAKYDLGGNPIGSTIVEQGELNTLYKKTDEIIQRLVSEELSEQGLEMAGSGVLTTASFDAMIPYLKGVQAYRNGFFYDATNLFTEAIDQDSSFVLAYYNLIKAKNWVDSRNWRFIYGYYPKLEKLSVNLSGKTKEIVDAYLKFLFVDYSAIEEYEKLYEKYGESLEILDGLAESYYHFNPLFDKEIAKKYFKRLIEIDPDNTEYYLHLADIAITQGNVEELDEAINNMPGDSSRYLYHRFNRLLFEDTIPDHVINRFAKEFLNNSDIPHIISGPLVEKGLRLRERILNAEPELLKRDRINFEKVKKIIGGQHSEVIQATSVPGVMEDLYDLSQLCVEYFPPEPDKAADDINKILAVLEDPSFANTEDSLDVVTAYSKLYHGRFSLLINDVDGYQKDVNHLATIANKKSNGRYWQDSQLADFRFFHQALLGIHSYYTNDPAAGKVHFDKGKSLLIKGDRAMSGYLDIAQNIMLQAEASLSAENYEEALDIYLRLWSQGIQINYASGYQYGRYMYRIAQCHDALGNIEEAIAYYNKFANAYEKSDETYQGWVKIANERLNALIESPERMKEPEEL